MNGIIGQEKLKNQLIKYNYFTLPRTILLLGEKGSGKHYIMKKFASHLHVDLVEIDPQCTAEEILSYFQDSAPKLYYLDLTGVTEKQQNKFLKLIEEPSINMRIALGAESDVGLLPTIKNRCITFRLEEYTLEQLRQFSWAPQADLNSLYKMYRSPGQLLAAAGTEDLNKIRATCEEILKNLKNFDYPTLMGYSLLVNCKDDYTKYDFDLFLRLLTRTGYEIYRDNQTEYNFKVYLYLNYKKVELLNKTVNKDSFIQSLLNGLWEVSH